MASEDFHEFEGCVLPQQQIQEQQEVTVKFELQAGNQPNKPYQSPSKPNTIMSSPASEFHFTNKIQNKKVPREMKIPVEDNFSNPSSEEKAESKLTISE